MDIEKLANEADKIISDGNIISLSKSKLIEYIQALSCININVDIDARLKTLTQAQFLTSIYNTKVIETLDKKNTILTRVVITLASFSFVASTIQICIMLRWIH